jgi:tripartite-type tricarboxylate transporter receptor subunit TctC
MVGRLVVLYIGAVLTAGASPAQSPSGFPARLVKFIIPFPAGGINDVTARIVAEKLQVKWGQTILVENKTGAGGNIAAEYVAQAEPDGHTIFITPPGPLAINQSLYRQLAYKPQDFVAITLLASVTNVIMVRPELGVGSIADLSAVARKNPGKLTYGSQGNGSTPHLTGSMFMTMAGVSLIHVPYRGENLVINDLLGGHVDVFFGGISPALPHYREGTLKILAVTDVKRAALMPDVPTAAEAGLPGLISTSWFAAVGPPKMPQALANRIAAEFIDVLKMPDVQAKFRAPGTEPVGTTSPETAAFIRQETARWREVITKSNIRIE